MKSPRISSILAALLAVCPLTSAFAKEPDPGQISISVGRLLEQGHYSRKKIDDATSKQLLKTYINILDYNHLFLTQQDVDGFQGKYGDTLDDSILLGDPQPAYDIYDLFLKRVEERIAKVHGVIEKNGFTFTTDRTIELNREKAPFPKDDADADALWFARLEGEWLQEKLSEHPIDPPAKVLARRYDQFLRNIHEQTREDALKFFLNSLALSYDPHSEYLSRSDLETFNINMRLKLVGIGAVLQNEDGYAKIKELVTGGPAEMDGRLKVGDRISAVAQGENPFEDTVGLKLDKVVERIRGKKGTVVKLQVIPVKAADPAQRRIIDITRDEVKLKEQAAKAEIIERPNAAGVTERVGVITLPSFYAEMENPGAQDATSTTKDVRRLVERLKRENIAGLVMDLRRNGGGSLEEAINLTGLFIKKGPVVQAKDANGNVTVSRDKNSDIVWSGPMVVMINRLSASASEIFAAALQDYGRAVIVGDSSTFGKGTVQTMLEIGRFIPFLGSEGGEAGALKLTIQKFYRVAGGSTQLRGVIPDVKIPSTYDNPEIGEASLTEPMPYDEVNPTPFDKPGSQLFLSDLKTRSATRVAIDREFRYVREDLEHFKQRRTDNRLSLNEKVRRTELAEDKARKEKRTAERTKRKLTEPVIYSVSLDNVDKPELILASNEIDKKKQKAKEAGEAPKEPVSANNPDAEDDEDSTPDIDAVRIEAVNIAGDLVQLNKPPKTASAQ